MKNRCKKGWQRAQNMLYFRVPFTTHLFPSGGETHSRGGFFLISRYGTQVQRLGIADSLHMPECHWYILPSGNHCIYHLQVEMEETGLVLPLHQVLGVAIEPKQQESLMEQLIISFDLADHFQNKSITAFEWLTEEELAELYLTVNWPRQQHGLAPPSYAPGGDFSFCKNRQANSSDARAASAIAREVISVAIISFA